MEFSQFAALMSCSTNNIFIKSAVFWVIKRRRVVIVYRRFGTTIGPILTGRESEWQRKPIQRLPQSATRTSVTKTSPLPQSLINKILFQVLQRDNLLYLLYKFQVFYLLTYVLFYLTS